MVAFIFTLSLCLKSPLTFSTRPPLPPSSSCQLLVRDRSGNARSVTLTGWTALAGIAAFIVIIMWGVAYAWRRYRGGPAGDGYTLVVKKPLRS